MGNNVASTETGNQKTAPYLLFELSMCDHDPSLVIEDSGMCVCTGCGRVLEDYGFVSEGTGTYVRAATSYSNDSPQRRRRHPNIHGCWQHEKDPETQLTPAKIKASEATIAEVCQALQLNDAVRTCGCELHQTLLRLKEPSGGFRGHQFRTSAISAVYFACILHKVSRAEVEFAANLSCISRSQLTTMNKLVRRLLCRTHYAPLLQKPLDPAQLVPRFLRALEEDPPMYEKANSNAIRRVMEDLFGDDGIMASIEGRTPECTCAAAAVVAVERFARGHHVNRKEVALRCGVSFASINSIVHVLIQRI